jgi:hypothetical protein
LRANQAEEIRKNRISNHFRRNRGAYSFLASRRLYDVDEPRSWAQQTMDPMQPIMKISAATASAAVLGLYVAASSSSMAQEKPGRYVMSPVESGFARLDTETGAMSLCKAPSQDAAAAAGWACTPMIDEAVGTPAQLRKLEAENSQLRAEVKRMEDLLGLNGEKTKEPERHAERPRQEFKLPSEQDVDKALSYFESMVKKFHDSMKRLEGRLSDKSDI